MTEGEDTVLVVATDAAADADIEVDGEVRTFNPGIKYDLPADAAAALAADGVVEVVEHEDDEREPSWRFRLPLPGDVLRLAINNGAFGHPAADASQPGLDDLTASKRAYFVEQACKEAGVFDWRAIEGDETLYFYDHETGVWDAEKAHSRLRQAAKHCLGPAYADRAFQELESSAKAETILRAELGAPGRSIAVANGLLDLETGTLEPLRREHHAIRRLPVAYDADATCERWTQFVDEVVEAGMADAVQEFLGYTLLAGELPIHRALMLVGDGSNGKSTLLNIVVALLGADNVTGSDLGDLAHNEYYAAKLYGALANIDTDVTGGLGGGGNFKQFVGGDSMVTAREPYGEPFDFRPTAKLLCAANEVPDTDVDDDAFFRRWLIVEFPRRFTKPSEPGPDIDPTLEDDLLAELPGILNWALDGLQRLLEQGHFTNEGSVADRRDRWELWGDSMQRFIAECLEPGDEHDKIAATDLHARYVQYCRDELNETPKKQGQLTGAIKAAGAGSYGSYRFDGSRQRGFAGLRCSVVPDEAFEDDGGGGDDTPAGERDGRLGDFGDSGGPDRSQTALHETVLEPFEGGDATPMYDAVVAYAEAQGFDVDRVVHHLDTLIEQGRIVELSDGLGLN